MESPFRVEYGRAILPARSADFGRYLVVTTATPWRLTGDRLHHPPEQVFWVDSLEVDALDAAVARAPRIDTVVGLGGGMAMDAAKYVAVQRAARLYLVPSITSGNGPFTRNIAIRRGGVPVGRLGEFTPEAVVVDYDLIRQAAPAFNRSGIADVLASYTALVDWEAAARAGRGAWREDLAAISRRVCSAVEDAAAEIGRVSDQGIRVLMEAFVDGAEQAVSSAGQRMFTGSEHLFTWNLEAVTGRHFLHGEVVGLGVILMYAFQGRDPAAPRRALDAARVSYHPEALALSANDLTQTLLSLPAYGRDVRGMYTWLDEREMTPALADRLARLVTD